MSSLISDLEPDTRDLCQRFMDACTNAGIAIRVTQTLRTFDEQAHLYAQGRTLGGPIVTHAPPGYSWHNWARAFDVCFAGPEPYPKDEQQWQRLGLIGEGIGLEWGGRWLGPKDDRPHFEHKGGLTLEELRAQAGLA